MSTDPCYLDSISLDLVTETDHQNNYCLCSKCTCGLHKCPKPNVKLSPKSIFHSYYKINYKRHPITTRASCSASPVKKSQFRLETETTSNHAYRHWSNDYSLQIETPPKAEERPKFRGTTSSTYVRDFAYWGTVKTESVKVNKGVSGTMRFNGTSTYRNSFGNAVGKPARMVKPQVNTNIFCGTGEVLMESTMQASYLKYNVGPVGVVCRGEINMNLPALPGQYQTLNSLNFNEKVVKGVIRRVKKAEL